MAPLGWRACQQGPSEDRAWVYRLGSRVLPAVQGGGGRAGRLTECAKQGAADALCSLGDAQQDLPPKRWWPP